MHNGERCKSCGVVSALGEYSRLVELRATAVKGGEERGGEGSPRERRSNFYRQLDKLFSQGEKPCATAARSINYLSRVFWPLLGLSPVRLLRFSGTSLFRLANAELQRCAPHAIYLLVHCTDDATPPRSRKSFRSQEMCRAFRNCCRLVSKCVSAKLL